MPEVGDKVLMTNGLVGTVTAVCIGSSTSTLSGRVLYDIEADGHRWRMTSANFTFPVPKNVVPMFKEPMAVRKRKQEDLRREELALAKRLRGDYDETQ